jgi:hypothetical protein
MLVSEAQAVLALTIIDGSTIHLGRIDEETKVLLAVRNPNTNSTHPNVISVPTQRIPQSMLENLISSTPVHHQDQQSGTMILGGDIFDANTTNGSNALIFGVESLLSRKLGLADYLENNKVRFVVRLAGVVTGVVTHPDHSENTSMINAVVIITEGAQFFPTSSASYSHIIWTNVSTFFKTAAEKNSLLLSSDLSPFEYCIHGLCIMSAYNVIAHSLGTDFYPHARYGSQMRPQ